MVKSSKKQFEYDIALSFAGEDRKLVDRIARELVDCGVRVFYDEFFVHELWGKDLFQHLQSVYRDKARFCLIFVSKSYKKKVWPKHELRQAQERSLFAAGEYILPVVLDDVDLPGLNKTTGYVDARNQSEFLICSLILRKLGLLDTPESEKIIRPKIGRTHRTPIVKKVTYGGMTMSSQHPAQIQKAQVLKHVVYSATALRIRYGQEFIPKHHMKANCADCGVRQGQVHVPGCDVEICPLCNGQIISCDCPISEYSSKPFESELLIGRRLQNVIPNPFRPDRFGPRFLRAKRRRVRYRPSVKKIGG